jgi:hypothetical protein
MKGVYRLGYFIDCLGGAAMYSKNVQGLGLRFPMLKLKRNQIPVIQG